MGPGISENRRSMGVRLAIMRYSAAGVIALLAVGFWVLQVPQHERYREMAENNHLRTLPLRAPRGVLFDRNGRVLVENRYAFNISLVREQSHDLDASIRLLARGGIGQAPFSSARCSRTPCASLSRSFRYSSSAAASSSVVENQR